MKLNQTGKAGAALPAVSSTDWMDELTTARDSIESVRQRAAPFMCDEDWFTLYNAMEVLDKMIAKEAE